MVLRQPRHREGRSLSSGRDLPVYAACEVHEDSRSRGCHGTHAATL